MPGMVPADVYELAWAGDPRISPDGSTVAFTVTRVDGEANDYRSAVYLAPTDRSTPPRRLTSGEKRDGSPRWSPDGGELAFVSNRDGDTSQLYVLPLGGGEARRLTNTKESVREPAWSPDGTRLAFVARTPDPLYDEEDEAARAPHRFTRLWFKLDDEGWTGDRRQQIYVVGADGSSEPVQLTEGDFESMSPTWSPDSAWIAFSSARDDDWDTRIATNLYVVAAGGGEPRKVTGSDGQCAFPAWSPDGALLAFAYTPGIFDDPRHAQLAVVPAKGGEQRVLSAALDRNCFPYPPIRPPAWDGSSVVFAVEDGGNNDLYRAAADGSSCGPILRGTGVTGYDAAGGDFVYTASTPTTFSELYLGGEPVTRVTEPFAARRQLSEPERFVALSKDGTEVEAWIMPPAGLEEGKRYPVLLDIHGGPFTQYTTKFFDEFQVLAGAGYAVVYANPRGSSGYSEEWGRAIRGPGELGPGWGSVDYEDLLAVTDEALSRFSFCDAERVGVLGGSYGGFMTSWIVGHTDRFRAACSERAVNNMIAEAGSSDIGIWFKGYTGTHWFEDPETHLRLSPSSYAQNVKTPLLILHSEDDLRCPVVNAEELFTILRILGREVEFVRFPHGEGHELSRSGKPRHRVQRFEILIDWFDRHLK
jgi:dipeptidyl aminopeptidase/acylaminoacyl peptidase